MKPSNQTLAFVFPGQGSQQIGMLKEYAQLYPQIEETFKTASQVLEKDLWELVQNGPLAELNNTVNTQPALLASGVALWRIWHARGGPLPCLLAGHSLGEYTALVCANALSLEEGIRLVAKRGALMQAAVPVGSGGMAAILGMDDATLNEVCIESAEDEIVSPVNFNALGQTVIAGNIAAVKRACLLAKAHGAKKTIMLEVSVPSHCALMRPAALAFEKELAAIKISVPVISVLHNVDVQMSQHPDDIRQRLVQQLYEPVRWVETIQRFVHDGVKMVVECGPGKVLSGLIKRIDPIAKPFPIETPTEMDTALAYF